MHANDKSVVKMVKMIITHYQIPVTSSQISEFLLTHPHYPELISISDAFDEWNIDHAAVELRPGQLTELAPPFIANFKDPDNTPALVSKIHNNQVYYQTPRKNQDQVSIAEFAELWDGVAIAIAPDEKAGDRNYKNQKRKEWIERTKTILAAGLLTAFLAYSVFGLLMRTNASILFPVINQLLLSAIGMILSVCLYSYDKGTTPAFIKSICTAGTSVSCDDIVRSRANNLFGILTWAEVGWLYFSGVLFSLLWIGHEPTTLATLAALNLVTLPYTFFSIYYQAIVAKKWCVLCMLVQGILWLQFLSFYLSRLINIDSIRIEALGTFVPPFGLSILLLIIMNLLLKNKSEVGKWKKEARRLKQHPDIFKNMLFHSRKVDVTKAGGFIIGNPEAKITITTATNLYCGPCAAAHKVLEEIIEKHKDVQLQCLFVTNKDPRTQEIVQYMGAIYQQQGAFEAQKALTLWFEQHDQDALMRQFPANMENFDEKSFIETHSIACNLFDIVHTPTVFINGQLLPDIYQIKDIPFWIPYLRQYCSS